MLNRLIFIFKLNPIFRNYSSQAAIKPWLQTFKGGSVYVKSINNDVMNLVIRNPEFHNSLTGDMMSQLDSCVDDIEKNPPKGLLVSSESGSFCSGAHLTFVEKIANPADGERMSQFMQTLTKKISNLPSLCIALIEGVAYGGGAELILCCDFRFMAFNGKISFKQRNLGVTTGWGGCHKLIQLIGKQEAMKLLLTCDVVNAQDAVEKGLVDRILQSKSPEERFTEALTSLTCMIDEVPKDVLFAIKKTVNEISDIENNKALDIERKYFKSVWGNKDHLNALKKFKK